ncbi:MAG: 50S ribosomal protein L32 [Dehalococcoidales bacterium]|nr:50S ribosomal protein L32 [Dehalococcoidales bacterium]
MAPLPKRRYAKSRQRERRGHMKIEMPSMDTCPQCHSVKLAHRVCSVCGNYNGRVAIKVETSKKRTT